MGDSQGFLHSARVWKEGRLVWQEVIKSSGGYGVGILMYWFSIKYLNQLGIVSPEIQTLWWFAATIIGVAIFSGDFVEWQMVDRIIAVFTLIGICWLLVRSS